MFFCDGYPLSVNTNVSRVGSERCQPVKSYGSDAMYLGAQVPTCLSNCQPPFQGRTERLHGLGLHPR